MITNKTISFQSRGIEILIVEDSPTQAQKLRHILEDEGFVVTLAGNGREALAAACGRKPAIIISDVVMPEMDGYELCRRVKQEPMLKDVPIILVTTMSEPQDVIRGLECGADNFILKPYERDYLLNRLRFVILHREMRQEDRADMGVQIVFNGEEHFITADRLQILNLLLSTYDAAVQRNKELAQAEERTRATNRSLEEANRELEAFSYSISHDLRAPLRHVQGYLQMLARELPEDISEKARRCLRTADESNRAMGQLIDDLLAFSRMGRSEMREAVVDLAALIQEARRGLDPGLLHEREIEWTIAALPRVHGDFAMLRQVFVNLLSNAVKYSRGRSPARIEIGCAGEEDGRTIVFVRDNGAGFDMKYADRLFGVFQRLHAAHEFEGTGAGLAIVRRIVARHGGRVWAEAQVDAGATFRLTLRQVQRELSDAPAAPTP